LRTQSTLFGVLLVLVLVLAFARVLRGESEPRTRTMQPACEDATDVRTHPAVPRAGSLFRVVMHRGAGASGANTRADTRGVTRDDTRTMTVSGEPLHFHPVGDSLVALAAVPIDSTHGITLVLSCDGRAPTPRRVTTSAGAYKLERLTVAPKFGAEPDAVVATRMRVEAEQAAVVSRTSHATPKLWSVPFIAPRETRITSGFGGGRMFNGAVTSRHMGTDYAGAVGAPVLAANRGVVRLIGSFYLGGNVIYIDHGEGLVTAYLHLSRQLVAVGDTVSRGMLIGRVGATGRVTGPHLHFITRYGAITVDAASVLSLR
jgi:hypothetical protein